MRRFGWHIPLSAFGSHRRPGSGTAHGCSGHNAGVCPPVLPYLFASLSEVIHLLAVFWVDHPSDVSGHLQEEQGLYDFFI